MKQVEADLGPAVFDTKEDRMETYVATVSWTERHVEQVRVGATHGLHPVPGAGSGRGVPRVSSRSSRQGGTGGRRR